MAKKGKKTKNQKQHAAQQAKAAANRKRAEQAAAQQQGAGAASAPTPDLTKFDTLSGTFLADIRKERAAQLLAEKDLPTTAIAAAVGVTRQCIHLWQQEPEFVARVEQYAQALGDLARQFLIGRKVYRLGNLQERLLLMRRVIDVRAMNRSVPVEEGGDTGLVVREEKMIGTGDNARLVVEYSVDLGLLKEMRETEKQAAQECGQWTEKKEVSGAGGGPLLLQIIEEVVDDDGGSPSEADQAPSSPEGVSPE